MLVADSQYGRDLINEISYPYKNVGFYLANTNA